MNGTSIASVERGISTVLEWLRQAAYLVAPLVLRIALALPFFRSGLTKWDGFLSLSPTAVFLFEEQFKLHILGGVYDLPAPDMLAFIDALAEIILPILLIVGFATRFSALGLLVMTGVIQLVVPDGWANFHLPWATMAVALIAIGPGALSLDHLIAAIFRPRKPRGVA
ncbi:MULTISPECIES: DoxX family protein [unclassified Mesorhizobium]|uniref:DoxX family protein n=1 Tax=unclassified Mesorhizobium TaxID=325217 RepID=UPI000FDB1026|nr:MULTISPECIES: DoxX family protein [unclassified Mesorhizobium]TGQ32475.1 DoxX family protein [Mesorhizobium sp. M00.F.Ca.ET.216.01.1.1]TIS57121.1 MAG: DoxX family membrane protein [Mesorhizobium sp.]TIS89360.1 MAG: DoxX family membrane protein [Mesorhizobium sp.]TJW11825.1 MAG: DoxX family membrane protein [Mesorhizobium sp.]TJW47361.1 MAG: DoxX family membrane protein [Mesorhizobium sp.]